MQSDTGSCRSLPSLNLIDRRSNLKLRSKFLLSLCAILLCFGFATVQAVQHICEIKIRQLLIGDLRNSVITFRDFQRECDDKLIAVSELLAGMPALKALMTTQDAATIQDGSDPIWRLAGSDLFVLSDQNGNIVALHSSSPGALLENRELLSNRILRSPGQGNWVFAGGRLFETISQPLYFGPSSQSHLLGFVTLGYEINDKVLHSVANIAASQVAFQYSHSIVSSTLRPTQITNLPIVLMGAPSAETPFSEIRIDGERFLAASLILGDSPEPVRLIVLKSFDEASRFVRQVNRIVVAISVVALLIGCGLVLFISRRFTKPLDELLEGVRALEHRDFTYPLTRFRRDEFAELTSAFDDMRSSLAAAEEKVLEAERSATIGRMASSISHDLRHRLTSIVANSEFLAESELKSERRQELYSNVCAAVRRMTDLLESLVEFSRTPDSLRLEVIPIEEIIEDSVAAIRLHPQFKNIRIRIHSINPGWGRFDPGALERGLYNLLLNACEVVSPSVGCIDIKIDVHHEAVEVCVSDNGPGIPESIRGTLFQPFVSHGKQHGSGLGLAIVQKACLDHGGKIVLECASRGTTTFQITLPRGLPFPNDTPTKQVDEFVHGVAYGV